MKSCLIISTYPPRKCGIATFSKDLRDNLINCIPVSVAAVNDLDDYYDYPIEVVFQIDQESTDDYIAVAAWVNQQQDIDLVIIQHEYGIYGGQDGENIISLAIHLNKPYILVTHTVLTAPSTSRKNVLAGLAGDAAAVICMTARAGNLLERVYGVNPQKIFVIPHGVPDFGEKNREALKAKYSLQGRRIITTFGLIGPGKGLELGLKALAMIVSRHPEAVYIIAGKTHPSLLRSEGEHYRIQIERQVKELRLERNVVFVNRFLSNEELSDYLYMTDIYLSPYPNLDQAVSGTLSFAVGCGRCIISTPYEHAQELLASGRGLLANEPTPEDLAELLNRVLKNPQLQKDMEKKAADLGESLSWVRSAEKYYEIAQKVSKEWIPGYLSTKISWN